MAVDEQAPAEVLLLTLDDAEKIIAGMKHAGNLPCDIEFFQHALDCAKVVNRAELLVVIKSGR
jgi:hypothetical protein